MPRQFRVTRDQAVWERETFYVTVPDEIEEDEVDEYLREYIDSGMVEADHLGIEGSVEGVELEVTSEEINRQTT